MKRYAMVVVGLVAFFLLLFAVVEALGVPLLTDPSDQLALAHPVAAAALGIGLLIADVALPVPSSLVMVAHGALFGAVLGALLSLVGSVGAALVGFAIGRGGGPLLDRLVPPVERMRANALLDRWGTMAIVITRPVPVLAETTAILAGATPSVSWLRAALAATVGALPAAALYAVAGALAVSFGGFTLIFVLVLALGVLTWFAERTRRAKTVTARESAL